MIYLFHNKETDEYREVEMKMKDYVPYCGENSTADHGGVDPVKKKYFKNYEKKTGKKHLADKKPYESKNVRIDYD